MSIGKSDVKRNTVRGRYTWSYLISCVKSRAVRSLISGEALSDKQGRSNSGFFCFLSSITPVGPPIFVL